MTTKEFDPELIVWNDPETVDARLEYYRTHWHEMFPDQAAIEKFQDD